MNQTPVNQTPAPQSPAARHPVVDLHGHLAVPAADALVAGTPGFAAELAAEQRAHSAESLAANREQLGTVVFLHPWGCSLGERLATRYLGNTVGQPVETTVALSQLIFTGVLDRFPRLNLVAAHGGGYLPTYIGRSDHVWHARPDARGCAEPPSSYLRRLWFDALVYTPLSLSHLVQIAGADRVVLGTDHPFDMGVDDPVDRLDAAGLNPAARNAVAGGNALRLLGIAASPDPAPAIDRAALA